MALNIQHYVVTRSRAGWMVAAEADRLSEHATVEDARREAHALAERDRQSGIAAEVIDLANDSGADIPH